MLLCDKRVNEGGVNVKLDSDVFVVRMHMAEVFHELFTFRLLPMKHFHNQNIWGVLEV